ncbi:MAG: hypothetical protein QXZ11_00365 [Thermoproteota archaeon]
MRNPFVNLDEFYGQPFPVRTSPTAEGLFMDEMPRLSPPPSPFATPFETIAPQEPVVRPVLPLVSRTSETAEGLFMEPEDKSDLRRQFPFLMGGMLGVPGIVPLLMHVFLSKKEKQRRSEGTVKKEANKGAKEEQKEATK